MNPFIRSELFSQHDWHGIFSTRQGGCSSAPFDHLNLGFDLGDCEHHVIKNYELLLRKSGVGGFPHQAKQVHASQILYCSGEGKIHGQEADILLADSPCCLAVRTADCVPILLVDPTIGVFSAVHAGWRGTEKKVVQKAIEGMQNHGAHIQHILATIGPCIGPCCFKINHDISSRLMGSCGGKVRVIQRNFNQWYVDLAAINYQQLRAMGVLHLHIEKQDYCTMCHPELFFSYRRAGGKTGRLLAIVGSKKL